MTSLLPKWSSENDRPPPEPTYFRKVLSDIWEGSFVLLVWTLLLWIPAWLLIFVLISFPSIVGLPIGLLVVVLGIAPALTGMMVMVGDSAHGKFMRLGAAWRGTFRLYWHSVALTLPLALMAALIVLSTNIASGTPDRRELTLALAFQVGIGLTMAVLHLYLLPLRALLDASLKQTVLLAALLAGKFVLHTLALTAATIILLALTTLHPLVWLFVPGVWCVMVVNAAWRLARRAVPSLTGIDK